MMSIDQTDCSVMNEQALNRLARLEIIMASIESQLTAANMVPGLIQKIAGKLNFEE